MKTHGWLLCHRSLLGAAAVLLCASVVADAARVDVYTPRAGATLSPMAAITESVSQSGSATISGSVGTPSNSNGSYSMSSSLGNVPDISGAVSPIAIPQGTFSTPDDATDYVGTVVTNGINSFAAAVQAQMLNGVLRGVVRAEFTLLKAVTITPTSGPTTQGMVSETCTIGQTQVTCLGASYSSSTSFTIMATYTQGAIGYGLPETWQPVLQAQPGVIQWAVLETVGTGPGATQTLIDEDGEVWHSIDTLQTGGPIGDYGAYDAYQTAAIGPAGPDGNPTDVIINCASISGTTCTYGAGDSSPDPDDTVSYDNSVPAQLLATQVIAPLIQKYGASNAVLLYQKTVEPVYDDNGVAQTAVSIVSRVLQQGGQYIFFIAPGGGGNFAESGSYGFQLEEDVDEYTANALGQLTYVTTLQQQTISPTQSFTKSVALTQGQTITQDDIINPFGTGNEIYSYLNDTVNGLPASAYDTPNPPAPLQYLN